jgi:hypothetical protein
MWSVCSTNDQVTNTLTEIQTKSGFQEFGDPGKVLTKGFRKDLASFKCAAEAGVTIDQLLVLYPDICKRYPGFVNSHIREIKLMTLKS